MATDISRRAALGILGGGLLLPLLARASQGNDLFLNAFAEDIDFGIAGFDSAGRVHFSLPLPQRGHSFARRADNRQAVAFTRRPGSCALIFDPRNGKLQHRIDAMEDRSFCGHGTYSADGKRLFATETIGSTGDGVIGVYAAEDGFRRVGEWPTRGFDPHEILLAADGRHLIVANGGILVLADTPRLKLNIPDMDPSLVYIDSRDGRLTAQIRPPRELHQLSLRHLAGDRRGRVAIAMQYEGPKGDPVPLVALHDGPQAGRSPMRFLSLPERKWTALRQYCGSAAMDREGKLLAVTSPRGNQVLVWNLDDERLLAEHMIDDVCGVAADWESGGFMMSNGQGHIFREQKRELTMLPTENAKRRWDNHMMPIRV
ncbi:MAG TPA: DUF1513 domain-containing protein [Ferrovibrio sp.]|uniref:DUF1513 domain-containing protein n=1 Tax=Ferrovibrio sp. TaxID=1917215 RepID=UPI002ED5DB21